MNVSDLNLTAIVPLIILAAGSCVLLLADLWIANKYKPVVGWLTLAVIVATAISAVNLRNIADVSAFGGMVVFDGFAYLLTLLSLLTGAVAILLSMGYLQTNKVERPSEFYVLLLFTLIGMIVMAMARDLIVIFLGVEMLSIPLYVLAGYLKNRADSEESAMKYFLLGAFASAFLVYGIAMVFGATQATGFDAVIRALQTGTANVVLLAIGAGLMLVGLGFKVAAVPFNMWTPDVYEGAPSPVTAFMSVGAKAAGFAALVRVFFEALSGVAQDWLLPIAVLAALTMIAGNVSAIAQKSVKRLLAYSSIAHAGYILMAMTAAGQGALASSAASAIVVYLVSYAITNLGTWGVVLALESAPGQNNQVSDFAGLGKRNPALAVAMTIFMLSLTGLPPTIGFVGKLAVFRTTMEAGFTWLAVVGVITSLVSAYYYLRVIVTMWMQDGETPVRLTPLLQGVVWASAIASFLFGILPASLLDLAQTTIGSLFQ
jgi:NADH-quinone oxidoreductase subunit N